MQTQGDAGHLIFSTRFHTCGMTTKQVDNNSGEIDSTPQGHIKKRVYNPKPINNGWKGS